MYKISCVTRNRSLSFVLFLSQSERVSPNHGYYFSIFSSSGVSKVLVSNLPVQLRLEELDLLFSNYGQVQNIEKVPSRDPNTTSVLISYETQEQVQQYVIGTLFYFLHAFHAGD